MSKQSEYSIKIQRYLSQDMTPKELELFEDQVKNNPQLQEDIKLYRKVENAISDDRLANFKNQLHRIHSSNYPNAKRLPFWKNRLFYAAAAFIILIIAITSILNYSQTKSPEDLLSEYYSAADITITRGLENVDLYNQAAMEYASENFDLAYNTFMQVLSSDKENIAATFYAAISAIEINKMDQAVLLLKEVVKSENVIFIQDARWYLALSYLKSDRITLAIQQFEIIQNENGAYASEAELILKSL